METLSVTPMLTQPMDAAEAVLCGTQLLVSHSPKQLVTHPCRLRSSHPALAPSSRSPALTSSELGLGPPPRDADILNHHPHPLTLRINEDSSHYIPGTIVL